MNRHKKKTLKYKSGDVQWNETKTFGTFTITLFGKFAHLLSRKFRRERTGNKFRHYQTPTHEQHP